MNRTVDYRTVAGLVMLAFCATSQGHEGSLAVRDKVAFDITAPSMIQALIQFTQQSGLQLAFPTTGTDALPARRVVGDYTPSAALDQLLQGSGLQYEFANERTISILSAQYIPVGTEAKTAAAGQYRSEATPIRLADAETSSDSSEKGRASSKDSASTDGLAEIFIRGSRLLNTDIKRTRDDVQPYTIFSHEDIQRSGATSVETFLQNRLTMNTNADVSTQNITDAGAKSSINLRGLGANQTLILVDGHRMAGAALNGTPQQPDLNGIPLSAIERIEILPTTASGIYGGGATGGVINIILRRDYSGVEGKVTYGSSFDGGATSRQVDLNAGFNLEDGKTSILLSGSFQDTDPLYAGQRDFVQRSRAHIASTLPTFFNDASAPPLGATTNISSAQVFDPATFTLVRPNLTLKSGGALNSTSTYVPVGYAGVSSDGGSAFIANAGQFNLGLADTAQSGGGSRSPLLINPRIESGNFTIRRDFGTVHAYLDLGASNNSVRGTTNGASGLFSIPSSAPNNPFNEDIIVTTPTLGADGPFVATNYVRRAVGGLVVPLGMGWQAAADYAWSQTRTSVYRSRDVTPDAAALVATGGIDVLKDTNAFPVSFAQYVSDPSQILPTHSKMKDGTLRFAGPLGSLPGGDPTITVLLEHRNETFDGSYLLDPLSSFFFPDQEQTTKSIYMEARIPLGPSRPMPGLRLLELQVAGRRDEYNVDGAGTVPLVNGVPAAAVSRFSNETSSTNPTLGLRYQPILDVMFRGSYSTGFVPPAVSQVAPAAPIVISGAVLPFFGLTDPRRGNESLGALGSDLLYTSGGNPELRPEESKSWSAGVVLTPHWAPDFRVSLDWMKIDKTDNITALGLTQTSIDNELSVPGLITRAAADPSDPFGVGPITGFNGTLLNIARTQVEALDITLDWNFATDRWGSFSTSLAATHLMHFRTQTTAGTPLIENAGVETAIIDPFNAGGGLRWKANASLSWRFREWTLGWTSRFLDSYWLNVDHSVSPAQGSASIPSQLYHDVFAKWTAPDHGITAFQNLEVQAGVSNVFNKSPPLDVVGSPFRNNNGYSSWGDPRLANYYLSIRKGF